MTARLPARIMALVASLAAAAGCGTGPGPSSEVRPDIILVVLDTVRADAVSSQGGSAGTTPHLDALAAGGLDYRNAYSTAPWTLPAHASLFTGLEVGGHGVGIRGRVTASPDLDTLAERLAEAGYTTLATSENPIVSEAFGLLQGFGRTAVAPGQSGAGARPFASAVALAEMTRSLPDDQPLFAFVNLFAAHMPYTVREANPFVPADASLEEVAAVRQTPFRICDRTPPRRELEILRGLYLGEVWAADRALGEVLRVVRGLERRRPQVVIVTSDHGEHLGEGRLLGHQFSLGNPLLHVPLVVHGLPGVVPVRLEAPVSLADVMPSILVWAEAPVPEGLVGRPLPIEPEAAPASRTLIAGYSDRDRFDWPEEAGARIAAHIPRVMRETCTASDRTLGDMVSAMRHPLKLIWYQNYPPVLHDLSWDPGERSDLASIQRDQARALLAEAKGYVAEHRILEPESDKTLGLDPEAMKLLRALGYAE